MSKMKVRSGVLTGNELQEVFAYCKETRCALPAVNVIGSSTINAAMYAAKQANSPIIIQFSNGGAVFNAGKYLDNTNQRAAVAGSVAGAHHIRMLSKLYGVPVILHTDHCARKLLPWVDGMLEAGEEYFRSTGEPLYSSHMLDLSEEDLDANIKTCAEYLERMAKINMTLEIELGVTGGEEDGVDNSHVDSSRLYTQPEEVLQAYDALNPLGKFTVAAAFGNTHGVYKPGNVVLRPEILKHSQAMIRQERGRSEEKPLDLVFHGGSGSEQAKITEAIEYGVVKMNIDTDTQWAFTRPIREYMDEHHDYLMAQIGNPEGEDKPNKKYIDPRAWMVAGEKGFAERLVQAFRDLNAFDQFDLG
ncbi:class II fructose-bisphosphate aldolase [Alkalispirochaeta sphaeroplastigenens]|uniref:Fructose-bisphosphate aldolase n=1 Tax=Alkalispirochaeta sphaeroplastigenens TaxID=1187066 RepID=A0A2S4JX98_9SPIO|nr:class II fructose-bisphosphate aldolase [Alkalispirochaeta sphaeroplastigenens]POR04131.1 class II fructose-bisphosphate aldolase [Alkalispirochaeta sphaeroplastigenens]